MTDKIFIILFQKQAILVIKNNRKWFKQKDQIKRVLTFIDRVTPFANLLQNLGNKF